MAMVKSVTAAILNVSSLTASTQSALSSPVDLMVGGGAVQLALSCEVDYQGATTQPAILQVYGSRDGATFDTFPFYQGQIPNAVPAGGGDFTSRVSFPIDASMAYIGVAVYNSDTALSVANVKVFAIVHYPS